MKSAKTQTMQGNKGHSARHEREMESLKQDKTGGKWEIETYHRTL